MKNCEASKILKEMVENNEFSPEVVNAVMKAIEVLDGTTEWVKFDGTNYPEDYRSVEITVNDYGKIKSKMGYVDPLWKNEDATWRDDSGDILLEDVIAWRYPSTGIYREDK